MDTREVVMPDAMPLERLEAGIEIDPATVMPRWYGDPLDLGHITTALWCIDQRRPPDRGNPDLD